MPYVKNTTSKVRIVERADGSGLTFYGKEATYGHTHFVTDEDLKTRIFAAHLRNGVLVIADENAVDAEDARKQEIAKEEAAIVEDAKAQTGNDLVEVTCKECNKTTWVKEGEIDKPEYFVCDKCLAELAKAPSAADLLPVNQKTEDAVAVPMDDVNDGESPFVESAAAEFEKLEDEPKDEAPEIEKIEKVDAPEAWNVDFAEKTVAELKEFAQENNVELKEHKRADIISELLAYKELHFN